MEIPINFQTFYKFLVSLGGLLFVSGILLAGAYIQLAFNELKEMTSAEKLKEFAELQEYNLTDSYFRLYSIRIKYVAD